MLISVLGGINIDFASVLQSPLAWIDHSRCKKNVTGQCKNKIIKQKTSAMYTQMYISVAY